MSTIAFDNLIPMGRLETVTIPPRVLIQLRMHMSQPRLATVPPHISRRPQPTVQLPIHQRNTPSTDTPPLSLWMTRVADIVLLFLYHPWASLLDEVLRATCDYLYLTLLTHRTSVCVSLLRHSTMCPLTSLQKCRRN